MSTKVEQGKIHLSKYTVAQIIFLTIDFYLHNNLYVYAASCAYSFLFSVIPIAMITITALVQVVRSSPEMIATIIDYTRQFAIFFDAPQFIEKVSPAFTDIGISIVDALSIFAIIWMARKLFATIFQGLARIFRKNIKRKAIVNHFVILAVEMLFVVISVATVFFIFLFRLIMASNFFEKLSGYFGWLAYAVPFSVANISTFMLGFVFVAFVYRFGSGTKPKFKICFASSAACNSVFFAISKIISLVLKFPHYSMVYGVLSSVMVFILEVYIYFIVFFVGAQIIYIMQFFDTLLIGEVYLLPSYDDISIQATLRRILFIMPDFLMARNEVVHFERGENIFVAGEKTQDIYYIASGSVLVKTEEKLVYYDRGDFFGERNSIFDTPRKGTATAISCCTMVKFDAQTFRQLIEKNPRTAEKAIKEFAIYN